MRVGKRTAKLIHEAAIMGFVQGSIWGRATPDRDKDFPKDSEVVYRVLRGVSGCRDLYPTLSRVETNEDYVILLARPRTARTPESDDDAGSPGPLTVESADRPPPQD